MGPVALTVDLFTSGEMRVDGEVAPNEEAVLAKARLAHAKEPRLAGIVIADPSIPHRRVIAFLELLERAGFDNVSYALLPGEEPPPASTHDPKRTAPAVSKGSFGACGFPQEADEKGVNAGTVVLRVIVGPDGAPRGVRILVDPGVGFGRAAATCAMHRRYVPGRNAAGVPVQMASPPIRVTFQR